MERGKGWQNGDFCQQRLHARLISVQKKLPAYLRSQCIDESCSSCFHLTAHHICKVTAILNSILYFVITKSFCKILYNTTQIFLSTAQVRRGVIGYRLSIIRVKATTLSLCVQITLSIGWKNYHNFHLKMQKSHIHTVC